MTVDVYVANVFSKDNSGGNKAGVVLLGDKLNEAEKTNIAYRLGYSETAFVSRSSRADFKLEYFTPAGEVPLCGHATIGTFVVLRHLFMLKKHDYTIETKSGILRITVEPDGRIFMEQNTPQFYQRLNPGHIRKCFDVDGISKTLPVQIVSTGLKDILVPIHNPVVLEKMAPNFDAISEISRETDCVGIHAFSLVQGTDVTAICRNFAPLYGIDEEAATGTSNCALACYLYRYVDKQNQYVFEQGYNLKSVSRIYVHIESENDAIRSVFVGGYGYLSSKKAISCILE